MESIIYTFNIVTDFLKLIIDGLISFFNSIPYIFNSISTLLIDLFPSDFYSYLVFLIPIIITLLTIRFIRG